MYDTDEHYWKTRITGLSDLWELDDKEHFIEELITVLLGLLEAIPKHTDSGQE